LALAVLGASLVMTPAAAAWLSHPFSLFSEVRNTQIAGGAALLIVWLLSVYLATKEKEQHALGCVLKAAGLPGLLLAVGQGLKIAVS
jgi:hypothetical protein